MLELIATIPLFSQVSPAEFEPILADRQLYLKRYTKGATVYNQDGRCGTFDIVLSGSLVAYLLSENGSTMTMFEFAAGQAVGANLLFRDNQAYPFTIYCLADAQLLHVTREAVSRLLHNYGFTLHFLRTLSDNSQKLNRRISMATQKSLRGNLLEYLWQQSVLQNSHTITLPISKKQLADYLGVQRPSLFRVLKSLGDEGLIKVSNRTIQLVQPTGKQHKTI